MGRKLHRKRRSYLRRRRSAVKPILAWVVAAAILIPGSFFAAKFLFKEKPVTSAPTGNTVATTTVNGEANTTTTTVTPVVQTEVFRGFTLPYTALTDTAKLTATAKEAVAAGFNCVVIELKNKQGNLLYVSETEAGKTVGAFADGISLKTLTDSFAVLRNEGVLPIPLLYCFEDALAPRVLHDAKVVTTGHSEWTWYDGDPKNGGKPWLNPYADAAQAYITGLAEELQTAGAGGIMLDGVYFPVQTTQADFTVGGDATLSKGDVLKKFVARMDTLCDIPVLLRCSANAALGNTTGIYHASPLDLGAAMVVTDMRQSAIGEKLSIEGQMYPASVEGMTDMVSRVAGAMKTRVQNGNFALLLDGATAATQVSGLKTADKNASFFLGEGEYTFSAFAQ